MQDFDFWNPTKILFGKGKIAALEKEIPAQAKVLLIYGGGSIKTNGVYDQVLKALKGRTVKEFAGVEPNPSYENLMKAVEVVKAEGIDFLLAVGGGSVIDGTKFIAAAALYKGADPWLILAGDESVTQALPFGTVLTLPATGSEMNNGSVVTKKATGDKLAFMSAAVYPKFSVLDPTTTFTLPLKQVSNGIVDAYTHVMEQYMTYPVNAPIQDRFAEALLRTLIEDGPKTLANPKDYEARGNMMWAATMALNGVIGSGVPHDWTTHMIGHEITAKYGVDHARTLAIVLPGTLRVMKKDKKEKLLQYADRVWGIRSGAEDERIEAAIEKTQKFFESVGIPTYLKDYGIEKTAIPELVANLKRHGMVELGERGNVTLDLSQKILETRA